MLSCSLLGERYKSVVQSRKLYSTGSILAHVEGLQGLANVLKQQTEIGNQGPCQDAGKVGDVSQKVESTVQKLVSDFTQFQRDVRMCATLQQAPDALMAKLSSRDTARAKMCREVRDALTTLFECVCSEKKALSEGKHYMGLVLADANSRMQQLRSALDAARDCVIKYNVNQHDVSVCMGASFNVASGSSADVFEALSLWQKWKAGMHYEHYEQVAEVTDACMKQSVAACAEGLGALLGVDMQQQQHQQKAERFKETLIAAGKAADTEAALHESNPILLVPVTPLIRAAEHILQGISARVDALQRACTIYEGVLRLHDAESQCLDLQGGKYAMKQKAVEAAQEASKAHTRARTRLKKEKNLADLAKQDPSLLEDEGMTLEELRNSIAEKKKAMKEAATVLHTALQSLLDVQEYFPEVCMHYKSGLPQELLSVWRADLTLDMFEACEMLQTASNHSVYKAKLDGKMFALKEFRLSSDEGLKNLLREAAMLRKIRHPTIIEIVSVFEDNTKKDEKRMFLQMPFFEHGTLDVWIRTEAPEWRAVRTVLLDIAGALEFLYTSSVVHCDVKPQNILIAPNCRGRLADFDISVDHTTRTTRLPATKVGYTASFDAPELARYVCMCVCVCMYIYIYIYNESSVYG